MRVLELFSGTRSVGKCCDKIGWESVSVDMLLPADHKCDIMDFDYKQYDKDYFDIIWASPPCVEYSRLKNCWIGRKLKDGTIYTKEIMEENMNEADKLVLKALEIIDYFNVEYWFIENPLGRLKDREIMKDRPFYLVDYCMFSDWGYKKRTCIWTNKKGWEGAKLCDKKCGNMENGKQHEKVLAHGYEMIDGKKVLCNTKEKRTKHRLNVSKDIHTIGEKKQGASKLNKNVDKADRYRVPEDLIFSLFLE